jgi:hypothetical protein
MAKRKSWPSAAEIARNNRRREAALAMHARRKNIPELVFGEYLTEQRTTAAGRTFIVLVRRHSTDG